MPVIGESVSIGEPKGVLVRLGVLLSVYLKGDGCGTVYASATGEEKLNDPYSEHGVWEASEDGMLFGVGQLLLEYMLLVVEGEEDLDERELILILSLRCLFGYQLAVTNARGGTLH